LPRPGEALPANRELGLCFFMRRRKRKTAKWQAQFEHLGRERVRYLVQKKAITPEAKHLAAEAWLSDDSTRDSEKWDGWDYAFIISGSLAGAIGVLIALK
jgi:hypothetical protein